MLTYSEQCKILWILNLTYISHLENTMTTDMHHTTGNELLPFILQPGPTAHLCPITCVMVLVGRCGM